ncbi:replication protein C, IncQ-type [Salinicola sp. MIT1003]|uniref:replication protein C, IncQ-type n=1 Tax=Salinicola sp. MIT1003 TaxID=1882734 RepID=UPI0008DD26C0|nr:replication protein C, IncQ-type [Salinicola sp. MIT1003]OHZ02983.1 hypothetical protein BC443_14940 [Salinicola sp. MIT1003]
MKNSQTSEITFAQNDTASLLAPIFTHVSNTKGERDKDIVHYNYNGADITFRMFEKLDAIEQSVLLAIVGLSAKQGLLLPPEPKQGSISERLLSRLNKDTSELAPFSNHPRVIKTSYYAILKASGMGRSKQSKERLIEALRRLSQVNYEIETDRYITSENMVSLVVDKDEEMLYVGISSILSYALENQYTYIDLVERKQLGSRAGVAHLLHARLSASVNVGRSHSFNAERMALMLNGYVSRQKKDGAWHEVYVDIDSVKLKNLKKYVVSSFRKIGKLDGWEISEKGKGRDQVFIVSRLDINNI